MNTAAKKDTIWGKQMQDIICGEWVNKKESGGDKTLQLHGAALIWSTSAQ